ncbi:MAG: hypothetical protein JEZ07_12315 [Phycisphaerae bacterium]|nr:hypothetical protein [Phycisphaerae bacterium]
MQKDKIIQRTKGLALFIFMFALCQEILPFIFYTVYDISMLDESNSESFISKWDELRTYSYFSVIRCLAWVGLILYGILPTKEPDLVSLQESEL